MSDERRKPTIVEITESVANISEDLDKIAEHIMRISVSGEPRDSTDIRIMLACTRYVASRQLLNRLLAEAAEVSR